MGSILPTLFPDPLGCEQAPATRVVSHPTERRVEARARGHLWTGWAKDAP